MIASGGLSLQLPKVGSIPMTNRIWTFVIAQGMTFHNGKRVTATDVKLAWERLVRQGVWLVAPQPLLQIRGAEVHQSRRTATQIKGHSSSLTIPASMLRLRVQRSKLSGKTDFARSVGNDAWRFAADWDRAVSVGVLQ